MELWNLKDLPPPPTNSMLLNNGNIDLKSLLKICDGALKILESATLLNSEAAILSRYIYLCKRKFRFQKGLIYLRKVSRALRRYLHLDLQQVYFNFVVFLEPIATPDQVEAKYAPTKQMIEYLIVRTLGFAKLMYFMTFECENAAVHYRVFMTRGHLINEVLFCLGLISRIWYFSKFFMMSACQWYSKLLPFVDKLQVCGTPWLPNNYIFPSNIKAWLGPNVLTGDNLSINADLDKICDEILRANNMETDLGEVVSRSEYSAIKSSVPEKGELRKELSEVVPRGEYSAKESKVPKKQELRKELSVAYNRLQRGKRKFIVKRTCQGVLNKISTNEDWLVFLETEEEARQGNKTCFFSNLNEKSFENLRNKIRSRLNSRCQDNDSQKKQMQDIRRLVLLFLTFQDNWKRTLK